MRLHTLSSCIFQLAEHWTQWLIKENSFPFLWWAQHCISINSVLICVQTCKNLFLCSCLYSTQDSFPKTIFIHARCAMSDPQNLHYPCIEGVLEDAVVQSHVHDIYVRVLDKKTSSIFCIFLKRHVVLPQNACADLQGDMVIMRVASRNRDSVVNLRSLDMQLADFVLREYVHFVKAFICN